MQSIHRRFFSGRIAGTCLFAALAIEGCVYQPTNADRAISFAPYSAVQVSGDSIHDFIVNRFGLMIQGADLTFTQSAKDPAISMVSSENSVFYGGSAAAIDTRGYFLTAAHCVGHGKLYVCTFEGNKIHWHAARIVWRGDASHLDLAILRLQAWTGPVFKWTGGMGPGDAVLAHGTDFDPRRNVFGDHDCAGEILEISAQDDPLRPGTLISHTAPLYHGDSGGPLADVEGRLIGINTGASEIVEIRRTVFRIPMTHIQQKAMRPDIDWLKKTIDEDFAQHPNG
jgi:S1-C subfamily serine protease